MLLWYVELGSMAFFKNGTVLRKIPKYVPFKQRNISKQVNSVLQYSINKLFDTILYHDTIMKQS